MAKVVGDFGELAREHVILVIAIQFELREVVHRRAGGQREDAAQRAEPAAAAGAGGAVFKLVLEVLHEPDEPLAVAAEELAELDGARQFRTETIALHDLLADLVQQLADAGGFHADVVHLRWCGLGGDGLGDGLRAFHAVAE